MVGERAPSPPMSEVGARHRVTDPLRGHLRFVYTRTMRQIKGPWHPKRALCVLPECPEPNCTMPPTNSLGLAGAVRRTPLAHAT